MLTGHVRPCRPTSALASLAFVALFLTEAAPAAAEESKALMLELIGGAELIAEHDGNFDLSAETPDGLDRLRLEFLSGVHFVTSAHFAGCWRLGSSVNTSSGTRLSQTAKTPMWLSSKPF
jgi:hypothetical protein